MIRKIGGKYYHLYAFDIESRNSPIDIENRETSAWLACFIDETNKRDDKHIYFNTIEEWLDWLEILTSERFKSRNLMIYIWNLSFEWSFIFPILVKRGYSFVDFIGKSDEYVYNSVTTKSCSSVWEASFKMGAGNGEIVLRDMCKIFPSTLKNVAKSFGLETQKDDPIDYQMVRPKDYVATDIEKHYVFNDVRIIVEILMILDKKNDTAFFRAVSAGSYACNHMIRSGFKSFKPMEEYRRETNYPILSKEENDFIRHAVAGGLCYATSSYQYLDIKQIIKHIDARQMHPSSAYLHRYPFGRGEYFKGAPDKFRPFRMCCCHVRVSYYGVKLFSVIKTIGIYMVEGMELYLWDFEIDLMKKCYEDLRVEYIDGYAYKSKMLPWRDFYKENFTLREQAKKDGDLFKVFLYKLYNNSSYGKLLENDHVDKMINIINTDGFIDSNVVTLDEPHSCKFTYLPVGSCIPAYSRVCLIETALKIGHKNCIYFDTDSIFFIDNEESREGSKKINYNKELGGWSYEKDIIRGQFTAPKRYKIIESDEKEELVVRCAGFEFKRDDKKDNDLTLNEGLSYDDINIVTGKYYVTTHLKAKGGTLIIKKEKSMSIQDKYIGLYNERSIAND